MNTEQERKDFYREKAYDWLLDIGAIKECEAHDDFYYVTHKPPEGNEVYGRLTARLKKEFPNENHDFTEFQEQIHAILQTEYSSISDCPRCQKAFNE